MRPVVLVVPGRLETPTGGYIYDRRIVEGLRQRGWTVDVRELDDGFPRPSATAIAGAARVLAAIPDGAIVLVDGLALGALPDLIARESARLRIVALVHLPLALEVGIDAALARQLEADERRALAHVGAAVATGRATADTLADYGVEASRIHLVEPGTESAPLARGSGSATVHLLSVGSVVPGKGHDLLIEALARLRDRDWRLSCAGSLRRSPSTVEALRARLRQQYLVERVTLVGELAAGDLADWYDRADVFVLATLRESYGMAVAEALARGLPIVSTTTGAIPALVGDTAGLLVPPGDVNTLADALRRVLDDRPLRAKLADGARRVRDRLATWESAVAKMATVLERVGIDG